VGAVDPGTAVRANVTAYESMLRVTFPRPAADTLVAAFVGMPTD
jgi:hypothetical protein